MRWKTRERKREPHMGDTRVVEEFAWLPLDLAGGNTIWLETYFVQQTYVEHIDEATPCIEHYWKTTKVFQ